MNKNIFIHLLCDAFLLCCRNGIWLLYTLNCAIFPLNSLFFLFTSSIRLRLSVCANVWRMISSLISRLKDFCHVELPGRNYTDHRSHYSTGEGMKWDLFAWKSFVDFQRNSLKPLKTLLSVFIISNRFDWRRHSKASRMLIQFSSRSIVWCLRLKETSKKCVISSHDNLPRFPFEPTIHTFMSSLLHVTG